MGRTEYLFRVWVHVCKTHGIPSTKAFVIYSSESVQALFIYLTMAIYSIYYKIISISLAPPSCMIKELDVVRSNDHDIFSPRGNFWCVFEYLLLIFMPLYFPVCLYLPVIFLFTRSLSTFLIHILYFITNYIWLTTLESWK